MPSRPKPRRPSRTAALLAGLSLSACATDRLALAPRTPEQPWAVPSLPDASPAAWQTVAVPGDNPPAPEDAVPIDPARPYDLAALIDLAARSNPDTREAWERARQAALAVGLVEATYAPQISAEIISGFQRTPLPIPTTLVPRGYFTTDTRELLPTLTAKWLLFDFGRRAGAEQVARENSFVANVAFTGAHEKLIYSVSRA
jgi:outer membrane protein